MKTKEQKKREVIVFSSPWPTFRLEQLSKIILSGIIDQ